MNLTTRFLGRTQVIPAEIHIRLERLAAQWLPASVARLEHSPGTPPPITVESSHMESSPSGASPDPDSGVPVSGGPVSGMRETGGQASPDRKASGRWLLPDRGSVPALMAVVLLGSVIAGWMWWQGRPRPVVLAPTTVTEGFALPGATEAGPSTLPPSSAEVVVHVVGSVKEPGLVRLPAGSRVDDAVKAAGGARSAKALSSVNLARQLVDGEQIIVGSAPGEPASVTGASGPGTGGISINSATAAELEDLPGVGPVLAERIVQWRTANGPFRSIDELGEVSGIGDSVLGQIRTQARL